MNARQTSNRSRVASALASLAALVSLACVVTSVGACGPRQKRGDWRSPPAPTPCASDTDCPGGACAIELGASQGTCGPASSQSAPGEGEDDGGAPGLQPAPIVQPSPSDIQI
jgi:hypothetical protein